MESKKVLCIDFDGVLHSYGSGWCGACNIPDPPVKGAIKWLRSLLFGGDLFEVCIYSSRSKCFGARRAMKKWLLKNGLEQYYIRKIKFPTKKPAVWLTIDDRAIVFEGTFPTFAEMYHFKPWFERKE